MSGDEPLAEVDVVVLRQSGADRGVLKDLGVASNRRNDQHFARLPDCEHCEIIALLLCHGITQVDIAVDNSGERFSDRRGIITQLCNAVERQKAEFSEEQVQLCWGPLAAKDIPYGMLGNVIFDKVVCAIDHICKRVGSQSRKLRWRRLNRDIS